MLYRSHDNLLDGIEAFIDLSDTVTLFSAYLKLDALEKINAQNKIKQIVVRWDERDLCGASPASDLEVFAYCKEHDIDLLRNKRLHMKALWNNESQILLGSANITKSGLGLRNGSNWELNGLVSHMSMEDKSYLQGIIENPKTETVDQDLFDRLAAMRERTIVKEIKYEEVTKEVVDPFDIDQLPQFKDITSLYQAHLHSEDSSDLDKIDHDLHLYKIPRGLDESAFHERLISAFNNHEFVRAFVKYLSEEASRHGKEIHRSMRYSEVRLLLFNKTTSQPTPIREIQNEITNIFYEWIVFCNSKITTDQREISQLLHYDDPSSKTEV